MNKIEYCWSHNEEDFQGRFDTREDAIEDAREYVNDNHEPEEEVSVWTGEIREPIYFLRKNQFSIGERLIEELDTLLFDYILSEEAIIELDPVATDELGRLVLDFIEKRASFNSSGVAEEREHKITSKDAL